MYSYIFLYLFIGCAISFTFFKSIENRGQEISGQEMFLGFLISIFWPIPMIVFGPYLFYIFFTLLFNWTKTTKIAAKIENKLKG